MSTVVILEPVSSGFKLIAKAKEFGHEVVVFTANTGDRVIPEAVLSQADEVVIVDTNEDDATLQTALAFHQKRPIHAVIPGFEYYVPLASKINAKLGLAGLNPERVNSLRYKNQMRDALEASGVRVPRYRVIEQEEQVAEAIAYVGFPSVIKPVDGSGSANVRKVTSEEEFHAAFATIRDTEFTDLGRVASKKVLVEEYVTGPEYSVEGFVEGDRVRFVSITEKWLGSEPYFVEVGHIVSAPLKKEQEKAIHAYVLDVLQALAVTMGVFHAEIRLSSEGPVLMEIGARLAGDRICDLIQYAKGIDMYEVMIRSYLGLPLPEISAEAASDHKYAGIKFFIRPELEFYSELHGMEQVQAMDGFQEMLITFPADKEIPEVTSFMGRLGFAIFVKDTYAELKETLESADRLLTFAEAKKAGGIV